MTGNNDFSDDLMFKDNLNFVKKPIPVLRLQQNEMSVTALLLEHVKSRDFEIQLFDVSEENLKNLKNTKQNF